MDIVTIQDVAREPFPNPIFTSPDVTLQTLLPKSGEFKVNVVNFGKGVRNKLHYHTTEQILIVTGGVGIVATEEREVVVKAGDVIRIPANVKHWHGATRESSFSHIYITAKDSEIFQVEE